MIRLKILGNKLHVYLIKKIFENFEDVKISNTNPDVVYRIAGHVTFKELKYWLNPFKPMIVHWVGTDVIEYEASRGNLRKIVNLIIFIRMRFFKTKGLSHGMWLGDELRRSRLPTEFIPISTISKDKFKINLDKKRNIDFLSYVPLSRFEFYGGDKILSLARKMPEYKFEIILPDISGKFKFPYELPENVSLTTKVHFDKMPDKYSNAKIFLRMTQHDGLSFSVLEALCSGCDAVWMYDFPHVIKYSDDEKLVIDLKEKLRSWKPNVKGREHVLQKYDMSKWKQKYHDILLKMKI